VDAGTIIGQAGETGNLASAIERGYAIQHLHIEIREGTNWNTATKKNPEEYVKTKFDSNGKVIESTKC
jgi:murein DD-endopeptidase MepM/ murein hydrolase activator NlpD